MRWRALLLSGLFAASVGLGYVSDAKADPPPWAGRWKHDKHDNGDWRRDHWKHDGKHHDDWRSHYDRRRDDASWRYRHDDDGRWRRDHEWNRDHDWWRRDRDWRRDRAYDGRYSSGYGYGYPGAYGNYGTNGAACSGIDARIARDQSKINDFSRSGRHQKARRWFEDDLQKAMRDRGGC